jgi:protein-disulfide isomerase
MRFLCAAATMLALTAPVQAQSVRGEIEAIVREYLAEHPEEVQRIVKDYLGKNPEVLQDAMTELLRKRPGTAAAPAAAAAAPPAAAVPLAGSEKAAVIKRSAPALFDSAHQVTLGDPKGDVTLVEFFDYSCGFCKRALADKLELLSSDPKLRIVLKEFPILGPGSAEAARIAVAVRMQDPGGLRYLEFHKKLLGDRMPPNRSRALAVAQEVGLDVARLERDEAGDEVRATLEESVQLARALGISGTPSYVVGDALVPGAVGAAALKERIRIARLSQGAAEKPSTR